MKDLVIEIVKGLIKNPLILSLFIIGIIGMIGIIIEKLKKNKKNKKL